MTFDRQLIRRMIRFAGVGIASSLSYVLFVSCAVELLGANPMIASPFAYFLAIPINYFGNRILTFASQNSITSEFGRFITLHVINACVAAGVMLLAVETLGLKYWIGSLFAVALIPISTFVVMELWVFKRPKP